MRYFSFIAAFAVLMVSCHTFDEKDVIISDLNPLGWEEGQPVVLRYRNEDTVSLRRISLIVRRQKGIDESLNVSIRSVTPDQIYFTESMILDMNVEITPYRNDVILSRAGEYAFIISPPAGEPVRGLLAIGVVIE